MSNGHEPVSANADPDKTVIGEFPKDFSVVAGEQQRGLWAVHGERAHQQDKWQSLYPTLASGYSAKSFVTFRKWFMLAQRIVCVYGTWSGGGGVHLSSLEWQKVSSPPQNCTLLAALALYLVLPDNHGTVQSNLFSYHFLHACKHNMHHRESQSWAKEGRGWFNAGDWFICFGGWETIISIGQSFCGKLGEWECARWSDALPKWLVKAKVV